MFKYLDFGESSAEFEKDDAMFYKNFFDAFQLVDRIEDDVHFLILGAKGSGKTAVSKYITLKNKNNPAIIVNDCSLSDFPYSVFAQIMVGDESKEYKNHMAWEYVLLLSLLNSFIEEDQEKCYLYKNKKLYQLSDALQNVGLLASVNLSEIVQTSKEIDYHALFKILGFDEKVYEERKKFSARQIFPTLKEVCYSAKLEFKHFIFLDGLDSLLTAKQKRDEQLIALASLVMTTSKMNIKFRQKKMPVKIVLLCRQELYSEILDTDSNTNKPCQSASIKLDWYESNYTNHSNIVKLVNFRAINSLEEIKKEYRPSLDIFTDYLPTEIDVNYGLSEKRKTIKYLLRHTRHTPRDAICSLKYIQKCTTDINPTQEEIKSGLELYSNEYFVKEIRNELADFLDKKEIESTIKLLGAMQNTIFTKKMLQQKQELDISLRSFKLDEVLHSLYECSAIGNVHLIGDKWHYHFKYRQSNSFFRHDRPIIVHKGLWSALNLIPNSPESIPNS